MAHPTASLKEVLSSPAADAARVAAIFDALPLDGKVAAARSLHGARLQGHLWQAAATNPRIGVADMVPRDWPASRPILFHGKNSLPAFTEFRKVCFRPEGPAEPLVAWGYNDARVRPLVGAGYYVLHDTPDAPLGGAAFDYTQLPSSTLPGWPPVRDNRRGLSFFVYANMLDYMRRVADDVFIGSAVRGGREMGSYFVVVRELPGR